MRLHEVLPERKVRDNIQDHNYERTVSPPTYYSGLIVLPVPMAIEVISTHMPLLVYCMNDDSDLF